MRNQAELSGQGALAELVTAVLGHDAAERVLAALAIAAEAFPGDEPIPRATMAMALNVVLFAGLLERVPTAERYVTGVVASGTRATFDHGALRTIDGPCGALPRGTQAFTRILEPLGYELAGLYPLPRLRMTGRAFAHRDRPYDVPQFFVSELHVDQLDAPAQAAAEAVFGQSRDPLGIAERAALSALAHDGSCPFDLAARALPGLAAAFGVQHAPPRWRDYQSLRASSAEAAWIATEGNAFNHATDRVSDVRALSDRLQADGWPIKAEVEVSTSGRVLQTAFIADRVQRPFVMEDGGVEMREVPGSFYEFITRHPDPETGGIDLKFDSANATGIFAVTSGT